MKPELYRYLGHTIMYASGVWIVSAITGKTFPSADAAERAVRERQ